MFLPVVLAQKVLVLIVVLSRPNSSAVVHWVPTGLSPVGFMIVVSGSRPVDGGVDRRRRRSVGVGEVVCGTGRGRVVRGVVLLAAAEREHQDQHDHDRHPDAAADEQPLAAAAGTLLAAEAAAMTAAVRTRRPAAR